MSATTTPQATVKKGTKRALCVGINDYPYADNDLRGCVNDAHAWAELLVSHYDFPRSDVKLLLDGEATKKNIIAQLEELLAGSRSGDTLVFTNSSHGSYIADSDGDEETYDEILCPHDIDANHIVDDELRDLIAELPKGARLTVILDNCFSGTATRARVGLTPDDRRLRFLNPRLRGLPELRNPWTATRNSGSPYPESQMKEVLLSGCSDKEYSYDAKINGAHHGAMTYYAVQAIREASYKLTYAQLHQRLVGLITDYPQHPQLEGSSANKERRIFG
jgi:hypothetical protein